MRKVKFLFLLSGLGVTAVSAQQTIPNTSMVQYGVHYLVGFDPTPGMLSPGQGGTGVSWDLSQLSTTITDTLDIVPVTASPFGSLLPGDRVLLRNGGRKDAVYLELRLNELLSHGRVSPSGLAVQSLPPECMVKFPIEMGQAGTGTYVQDFTFSFGQDMGFGFVIDSIRRVFTHMYTYEVDGQGTLTTPVGTFNALRQNILLTLYDTTYFYAASQGGWIAYTETSYLEEQIYRFWSSSYGYPMVTLRDIGRVGFIEDAEWIMSTPTTQLPEPDEASSFELTVYPNPTSDVLNIAFSREFNARLLLTDLSGRIMIESVVEQGRASLILPHLPPGTYLVCIDLGTASIRQKVIIR